MKGLLKNLGLILVVIGAVILVACSFTGNVNNNAILGSSAVLVVVGLISYIVINKRIADYIKRKEIKKAVCIYMQDRLLYFLFFSSSQAKSHQDSASGVISLYPFP